MAVTSKKPAPKSSPRPARLPARFPTVRQAERELTLTPLPPPKGTTKDLLADSATFGQGVDIARVAAAVDSRRRRRR